MSLAQLFYLKEAARQRCQQWKAQHRAWRSRRSRIRSHSSFAIETLENRILLAAAPLPMPVDFEPGAVEAGKINIELNYLQQQAPAGTPVSLQVDYFDSGESQHWPRPSRALRLDQADCG